MIMLLETLFCTVFFVLPLVGMFALVIKAAMRKEVSEQLSSRRAQHLGRRERLDLTRFKKRYHTYPVPMFENRRVLQYQLIECKMHQPLQLNILKQRANPRAGP